MSIHHELLFQHPASCWRLSGSLSHQPPFGMRSSPPFQSESVSMMVAFISWVWICVVTHVLSNELRRVHFAFDPNTVCVGSLA